jgi:hypothetical protein
MKSFLLISLIFFACAELQKVESPNYKTSRNIKEIPNKKWKYRAERVLPKDAEYEYIDSFTTKSKEKGILYKIEKVAKVVMKIGYVKASLSETETRELNNDSWIFDGDVIETNENSICDIELLDEAKTQIRIRGKSFFKVNKNFYQDGENPFLNEGKIFVRNQNSTKKDIRLGTLNWVASFSKAEFYMEDWEDYSLIKVKEGIVILKPYIKETELLSTDYSGFQKILNSNVVQLNPGDKILLDKSNDHRFRLHSTLSDYLLKAGQDNFPEELEKLSRNPIYGKDHREYIQGNRDHIEYITDTEIKSFKEMKYFGDQINTFKYFYQTSNPDYKIVRVPEYKSICSSSTLPPELIGECFQTHATLSVEKTDQTAKYYSLLMSESNITSRMRAYEYYLEDCKRLEPQTAELIQYRIDNHLMDYEETFIAKRTLSRYKTCKQ